MQLCGEWNAPKPRHLSLLEVTLHWKTPIKQQFDSGLPCQIKDGNLASTLSIPHHYQRDLRGIFMYFLMEDKNGGLTLKEQETSQQLIEIEQSEFRIK
ncbi:hypothetical protein E1A91_A03G099600v1 [Gossypium mustelinum]|uniref:Uncharacterized protein n=1 Tax=Gossypium mustelinum TaxID=34275 RepID=A0A5D2ZXC0_GOSMU|nr:hypothetical protein E1A91_A03G099600v1 [Gossypium mustelinum]